MIARTLVAAGALLGAVSAPANAQEGGFDVLDAETLYKDGWIFGIESEYDSGARVGHASHRHSNPGRAFRRENEATASVAYGLRRDVQCMVLVPFLSHWSRAAGARVDGHGLGDVALLVKWRPIIRLHEKASDNYAVILGIELPTGSVDERDRGIRLPMPMQPGSGSLDGILGLSGTWERARWKYGVSTWYRLQPRGGHHYDFGDEWNVKLSTSNKFWIEAYPGPSASLGGSLRWRHRGRDRVRGRTVPGTGGERLTLSIALIVHPTPSWDVTVSAGVPLWNWVQDRQVLQEFSISLGVAYRI